MKWTGLILLAGLFALGAALPPASGTIGVYGIVQRVVFEPDERAPERIRVYGAFAYADGGTTRPIGVSEAKRGYLYFKLPAAAEAARREWMDMKAVAGTGQAIGFGDWFYYGQFSGFRPDALTETPRIVENTSAGSADPGALWVRPDTTRPSAPMVYGTNVGVVRLTEASHAGVIARLRAALR